MNSNAHTLTLGSIWRRWEPHIHAPGTTLNDQFGGADAWDTYLSAVESSDPKIEVLGVTDDYLLDTYRAVLLHKANSRLVDVTTIFPNIELRLTTRAANGFVNIHLLIDPTEDDHIEAAERFLGLLDFEAHGSEQAVKPRTQDEPRGPGHTRSEAQRLTVEPVDGIAAIPGAQPHPGKQLLAKGTVAQDRGTGAVDGAGQVCDLPCIEIGKHTS